MAEVEVGGRKVTLERFTLAKAMRVITLLSVIQKAVPEINKAMAEFRRNYEEANVIELDRVQAKMRYGPQPVLGEDGEPMFKDGELLTIPSPIDRMSETDWERAGQTLRLRQSPATGEIATALFPLAFERAEQPVMRLLALVAMPNDDVERYVASGEIWDRVDDYARDVIGKAYLEEIMELAVCAAETIEGQVMAKARGLGERAGNLRRLFGNEQPTRTTPNSSPMEPTTLSEPPEPESTESVSDSPESSTGNPTESDNSPGTPSSPSRSSSLATAN